MRHLKFDNLTRISKTQARKLWGKRDMSLCPVNLRPGFPWRPNCDVFAKDIAEAMASEYEHVRRQASFDSYVAGFEWYNCPDSETGTYTAFYLIG